MTGLWTPPPWVGKGPVPRPCGQDRSRLRHIMLMAWDNDSSVPLGWQLPHARGCVPGLCPPMRLWPAAGVPTARAGKRGQLPDPQKVCFCSSRLPSPPKEAAEILLSPVLLHLSCKNRKNPTVLTGTSPASESIEHHRQVSQIFLLQQEKKKIN